MALTFVVESGAGLTTATSYVSLADASTYLERHLYATAWLDADEDQQAAALVWATQLLDEMVDWAGEPASTTQALGWPRANAYNRLGALLPDDAVPAAVKNATAELARALLADNRQEVADTGGVTQQSIGPLSVTYGAGGSSRRVLPSSVYSLLGPLVAPRLALRA